jgi:hypothetical protein
MSNITAGLERLDLRWRGRTVHRAEPDLEGHGAHRRADGWGDFIDPEFLAYHGC